MSRERGTAFLLKINNGLTQPSYSTVAGLKTTSIIINGERVTTPSSGGWRELVAGCGTRSVDIAGSGIFTGSTAEQEIRGRALTGTVDDYELSFESGEKLHGRFLITRLEYVGDFNGERNYSLAMESSGEVRAL